jgi:hypothetical protein
MKTLFFLTITVLLSGWTLLQDENMMDSDKILYRGYQNVLELKDLPIQESNMELVGIDNITIKKSESNSYILNPGAGKTAKIELRSQKGDVLGVVVFKVHNMPKPELYFCNQKSGNEVSQICSALRVDFPDDCQLKLNANILKWEYHSNSSVNSIIGTTTELDSLANLVRDLPIGTEFTIMADVMGPDSKVRKIAGNWIKK